MEDSRDPQVWSDAEARSDTHRHDLESARLLSSFIATWAPVDGFSGAGGTDALAGFLASAAVFHHDKTVWELLTQRQFEILDNRLLVPLHKGVKSSDERLVGLIKHAALVSLAQRADESFLTQRWFQDLEALAAMPFNAHGNMSDVGDALVASLIQGNHLAEHKIADDAPGRALQRLSELGSVPTVDAWCVLAMAETDRWVPAVASTLVALKVRKPLPSEFIERIGTDQFSSSHTVYFRRAIARLGTDQ